MDKDNIQLNINAVKELLLDEQKLITYVSISKELCVHVNDGKSLLKRVIEDIRSKQPKLELNVNYIISGLCEDNSARTTVCTEKEITNLRKTFRTVFFEHVYSVSKGLSSTDNVAFMAVNKIEDLPLCIGLIKSNACKKRTLDETINLKSKSQECVVNDQKLSNVSQKVKEEKKTVAKDEQETKATVKVHETKSEPAIKTELQSPKKATGINNKQNQKSGTNTGIAKFFNKSNSVSSKKVVKESQNGAEKVTKHDKIEVKPEKMDVDESDSVKQKVKVKESLKPKTNNKLEQIKKNAKVDKKRKRVLHVSDSESEDEKDIFVEDTKSPLIDNESEDEIPQTPAIQTVKITSGIVNPKKKRKIVDKTYTDEDGYIITKKEEIYESCSDHEEQVDIKENIKQSNHIKTEVSPKGKKSATKHNKKISPPQKGKQSTMMNFFKKI